RPGARAGRTGGAAAPADGRRSAHRTGAHAPLRRRHPGGPGLAVVGCPLMRVLVVNAGSSTLKLALLDGDRTLGSREVEVAGFDAPAERAIHDALDELGQPDAVGHRVVHGGGVYRSATRIDPDVRARLADFVDLAPLHQPAALAGIDLV